MKIERFPKKTTREWRIFIGYLKGLGFFDRLEPDLFAKFDQEFAEQAVENAA